MILRDSNASEARLDMARDSATFPATGGGVGMTDSNFPPQLIGVRVQGLVQHSLASCEGFVSESLSSRNPLVFSPPAFSKFRKLRAWRAAIAITVT